MAPKMTPVIPLRNNSEYRPVTSFKSSPQATVEVGKFHLTPCDLSAAWSARGRQTGVLSGLPALPPGDLDSHDTFHVSVQLLDEHPVFPCLLEHEADGIGPVLGMEDHMIRLNGPCGKIEQSFHPNATPLHPRHHRGNIELMLGHTPHGR